MKRKLTTIVTSLTFLILLLANPSMSLAQECPRQLMFSIPPYHFYSIVVCPNTYPAGYLVFTSPVATGCKGTACNTTDVPYARNLNNVLARTANPDQAPLPGEAELTLPMPPGSQLSRPAGYPKYVKTQLDGGEQIFMIYHVAWYSQPNYQGTRSDFYLGVELASLPDPGTPTVTPTNVQKMTTEKTVKLTVDGMVFQALYK